MKFTSILAGCSSLFLAFSNASGKPSGASIKAVKSSNVISGSSTNGKSSPFANRHLEEDTMEEELMPATAEAEELVLGAPNTVTLTDPGDTISFWYEFDEEHADSTLNCRTSQPGGGEGDADLRIFYDSGPTMGDLACRSLGITANETCDARIASGIGLVVEVTAISVVVMDIVLICGIVPMESIVLGVDMEVPTLNPNQVLYMTHEVTGSSSIVCELTGPDAVDADLILINPEGENCVAATISSNETCSLFTEDLIGTMYVLVHNYDYDAQLMGATIRCLAGPAVPLVLGTITVESLAVGEFRSYLYPGDQVPSQLVCDFTSPDNARDFYYLTMVDSSGRGASSEFSSPLKVALIGAPLGVRLWSLSDDAPLMEEVSFECSNTGIEETLSLELGIPQTVTVSNDGALFFTFSREEMSADYTCSLTAEDGHEGDVDLSVFSNFTGITLSSVNEGSNELIVSRGFRADNILVALEEFGVMDQEVVLLCTEEPHESLLIDEVSPSFTLTTNEKKIFVLEVEEPSLINCTLASSGNGTEFTFEIWQEPLKGATQLDNLCTSYNDNTCFAYISDPTLFVNIDVSSFNSTTPEDKFSVICSSDILEPDMDIDMDMDDEDMEVGVEPGMEDEEVDAEIEGRTIFN